MNEATAGVREGSGEGPASGLRARVETQIGRARFRAARPGSPTHATIWRVDAGGASYALKEHVNAKGYRRELAAYRRWLPRAASAIAPTLVGAFDGPAPALLTTWVEGSTLLDRPEQAPARECALYEAAGRVSRALHAIPLVGESRIDLAELVRRKIHLRAESLKGELPPSVAAWARRTADAPGWERLRVGACHRDFSPRNWMVSPPPGETVTLIDFEHAEFDFLAIDAMKLWDGPFVGRPDLCRAFYAGYGLPIADAEAEIRLVAPAHGLAILAWSLERGDFEYAAHGRAFLARAAASDLWFRA